MTASDKMFEFINDVSSAVATAKQSKLQADIVLRDVQTIREELKTVESLTQTNALVDEIAATIIDQPAFRDKIKRSAPMPTYAIARAGPRGLDRDRDLISGIF